MTGRTQLRTFPSSGGVELVGIGHGIMQVDADVVARGIQPVAAIHIHPADTVRDRNELTKRAVADGHGAFACQQLIARAQALLRGRDHDVGAVEIARVGIDLRAVSRGVVERAGEQWAQAESQRARR